MSDIVLSRPAGAISVAEWGSDRHRLIARPRAELAEIEREIAIVRAMLDPPAESVAAAA